MRLVERLCEPSTTPVVEGSLSLPALRARWDAEALILERGERIERIDASRRVSLQLSRWRRPGRASAWMALRGVRPAPRDELHAELRGADGLRLAFVAPCDDAALLEGLPWLTGPADAVALASTDLVALLQAAVGHGAQLVRWEARDAAQPPASGVDRALPPGIARTVVLGDHYALFGLLWMLFTLPLFAPVALISESTDELLMALGFGGLFVGVGAVMLLVGVRRGLRALHLVRYGRLTTAVLRDKRPTGAKINNQTVYALTFAFHGADGREHLTRVDTHETKRLVDEPHERLLYDEADPQRALPVDALPGDIGLDDEGRVQGQARVWQLVVLGLTVLLTVVACTAVLAGW